MVLLDTCALLELCKSSNDQSFSLKKRDVLNQGVVVLSVSFAELACKIKAKKLKLGIAVNEIYHFCLSLSGFEIVDIGVSAWLDSIEMTWAENQDPADRVIVSYAMKNRLAIVTTDQKMKAYYQRVIW